MLTCSTTIVLRDGSSLVVRPIGDDDGERLERFHDQLSPETQYRRFFSAHTHLTPREVWWFTHVDHLGRDAFVALDSDDIVGVGRLDRSTGDPDAEVAFVVADAWQGHGLGTELLRHVIARARDLGVHRLWADTLLHNDPMLAVFRHSRLPYHSRFASGLVHVTLDLDPPPPGPLASATAE
jgi:RimJ/RimL family protein N-acetyltransferase